MHKQEHKGSVEGVEHRGILFGLSLVNFGGSGGIAYIRFTFKAAGRHIPHIPNFKQATYSFVLRT